MLAKQKEGDKNPWSGPRLSVKSMGGSLVRFNVSLNDRSDSDEYYGATFSIQLLTELSTLIGKKLLTDDPFEIVISQTRWSKATSEEITGALCLIRNDSGNCFFKLEMAGKQEVLFPFKAMDKSTFLIDNKEPEQKGLSSVRCYSWWNRLCTTLDVTAVVLLALDATSFGGDDNVSSGSGGNNKADGFDSNATF